MKSRIPDAALGLLVIAAVATGAARAGNSFQQARSITPQLDAGKAVACAGVLTGDPAPREWGARMDVRLESCATEAGGALSPARGSVRLNARKYDPTLISGDGVEFSARFSLPREFKDPGAFSYRGYLISHNIGAVASAQGSVAKSGRGAGALRRILHEARQRVSESIEKSVSMPSRAIVEALATGSRDDMTQDLRDAFSLSGLSHLLAISGLHVGYVALFVYLILRATLGFSARFLERVAIQRAAALITLPAVWAFVAFTGGAISAVRAALMITVYLAGVVLNLRQDLLTSIAAAAIAILLILPLSILDISFQLSITAVAGIAVIAPPLGRLLRLDARGEGMRKRALKWIAASAVASFAAGAATAPLVAYHFKIFTGIGLIANMVAIPLTGLLLEPLVLTASLASLAAFRISHHLWIAAGWAAEFLAGVAHAASDIGSPAAGSWAPSAWEALLAYAVIGAALLWRRLPARSACALALAAMVCLDVTALRIAPLFDRSLTVTYFDVGQGDSALVRFPGGRTMLIDGGGLRGSDFDVGRSVLAPVLWRMGVRRLDWLLLTHPHHDHYGGLAYIAEKFSPNLLWTNGMAAPEEERGAWDEFVAGLASARVPIVPIGGPGIAFESGGAAVRIFRQGKDTNDMNDTSLIAHVSHGANRFLFTGDLTNKGEQQLLADGAELAADVLKVGHHGSRDASSSAFLAEVEAHVAVISAGERNQYRLPNRYTLARLKASGAEVKRTDQDGAVTVKSDGRKLEVSTYVRQP